MNTLLIILTVLLLAVLALLLVRTVSATRRQERLARQVRTTNLYGHVYPFLKKYDSDHVDTIIFRPESITIRTMVPYGEEARFTFARHGLDNPTQDTLFALAQAAMLDMHTLKWGNNYVFHTYSGITPNGTRYNWYTYTMKSACKDNLLRADARKRAENGPLADSGKTT